MEKVYELKNFWFYFLSDTALLEALVEGEIGKPLVLSISTRKIKYVKIEGSCVPFTFDDGLLVVSAEDLPKNTEFGLDIVFFPLSGKEVASVEDARGFIISGEGHHRRIYRPQVEGVRHFTDDQITEMAKAVSKNSVGDIC